MKEFFRHVKLTSLLWSLLYIAFGVCLCVLQNETKIVLVAVLGALIVIKGVISIVNYFLYGYEPFGFVVGVLTSALGVIVLCFCKTIADSSIWGTLFGIAFVFSSLIRMQNSLDYRRLGSKTWFLELIFAILEFALGIVVMCNPFASEEILLIFLGASIIVDGILQIVTLFVVSSKARKIKRTIHSMIDDIEKLDN